MKLICAPKFCRRLMQSAVAYLSFTLLLAMDPQLRPVSYDDATEVIVIAHPEVTDDRLSFNALRGIFGMRLHAWPQSGLPVKVVVLDDQAPLHQQFANQVLAVFPHQLRRAWDRVIYSGIGQAPLRVSSEQEMLTTVAETKGAVGYLRRARVDAGRIHVIAIGERR